MFPSVARSVSMKLFRNAPRVSLVGKYSQFTGIPSEVEQGAGRRKQEVLINIFELLDKNLIADIIFIQIDAEATGGVAFNRDPIVPDTDAGTLENPILVGNRTIFILELEY